MSANEKRLIDANEAIEKINSLCVDGNENWIGTENQSFVDHADVIDILLDAPTVDAVEVVRIEEVKQELLQTIDEFIAEYRRISESYVDHFGGKADAMETARRLVNAALTDLCSNSGAKMDGGNDNA